MGIWGSGFRGPSRKKIGIDAGDVNIKTG